MDSLTDVERMTDGALWAYFRTMISLGTYIQMDYAAGRYKCYEEFSARLDEAGREQVEHFKKLFCTTETTGEGWDANGSPVEGSR